MTEKNSAKMPQVPFGTHSISRLIIGSNQQNGASHQSSDMGRHMLEYFTVDGTVEFVRNCLAEGINTWQANYNQKAVDVLRKLREEGEDVNVIPFGAPPIAGADGKTPEAMVKMFGGGWPKVLEDMKPVGVHLVGMVTDRLWREGKMAILHDLLMQMRDSGVQVGVSTHIPEAIEYIEEKGWDVDYYLASLYKWQKTREEILSVLPEVPHDGHGGWELYLPSELPRMCETIKKTPKTCLAFKLFAGGRTCSTPEQVSSVFKYVFENIKPTDAVIVGMYPRFHDQMIKENADLVRKFG